MRTAIISDVHANLEALEAVFHHRDTVAKVCGGIDRTVCLGDIVDYGSNPKECVALVKNECDIVIAGNHDCAVVEKVELILKYRDERVEFESRLYPPTLWTRESLGLPKQISRHNSGFNNPVASYLADLPLRQEESDALFAHGLPVGNFSHSVYSSWNELNDLAKLFYISVDSLIADVFASIKGLCFIGHSHKPLVMKPKVITSEIIKPEVVNPESYFCEKDFEPLRGSACFTREYLGEKAIINVGSVGQPRDGDRRACYVILDDFGVTFHHVGYDINKAVKKMIVSGSAEEFIHYYTDSFEEDTWFKKLRKFSGNLRGNGNSDSKIPSDIPSDFLSRSPSRSYVNTPDTILNSIFSFETKAGE